MTNFLQVKNKILTSRNLPPVSRFVRGVRDLLFSKLTLVIFYAILAMQGWHLTFLACARQRCQQINRFSISSGFPKVSQCLVAVEMHCTQFPWQVSLCSLGHLLSHCFSNINCWENVLSFSQAVIQPILQSGILPSRLYMHKFFYGHTIYYSSYYIYMLRKILCQILRKHPVSENYDNAF